MSKKQPIGVIFPGQAFIASDPEEVTRIIGARRNAVVTNKGENPMVGTNGVYNRHAKHKFDIAKGFEVNHTRPRIIVGNDPNK